MRKLIALFVTCSAVLACDTRSGSSVTAPLVAELGTYTLQSVNGKPLPYALPLTSPDTTSLSLLADTLILSSGGNAREVKWIQSVVNGGAPKITRYPVAATYTITRDSISLAAAFGYRVGRYASGTVSLPDLNKFPYLFKRP